jgi:hypothetical protein
LQQTIQYKGFEVDFLLQFVKQTGKQVIFNNASGIIPGVFEPGLSNQPATVLDRWRSKDNEAVKIQRYSTNVTTLAHEYANNSNAAYGDASFARLKNVSVSWRFPSRWLSRLTMNSGRVFAQGQNLLTITNYKGLDPENKSTSSLPPLRLLTVGVQVVI